MRKKWNSDKLINHKGMTGKSHNTQAKRAISNAQKSRKHQSQEGFQKGHEVFGGQKTRFYKGQPSWNKGKGKGTDPIKLKYRTYKSNAKKRGLIFDVNVEEFKVFLNTQCYYCQDQSTGIDRVDNSQGYIKGNMVACCGVCNHMKWNLTQEAFIQKCQAIINKHESI